MTVAFSSRRRLGQAFVALAVVAVLSGIAAGSLTSQRHLMDQDCGGCHLARGDVNTGNAHQLIDSQERLCAGCHADALQVGHPSGFRVARSLPREFPLDWKSDLTCSTCHEVHGHGGRLMRMAASGLGLCSQCHEPQFFAGMSDGGESLLALGHVAAEAKVATTLKLDGYSVQCLECHAPQFTAQGFGLTRTILRHGDSRMNHPIGSTYSEYENYGGYRPRAQLNAAMLLPEGRLACVSCHRGYDQHHGELIVARNELCYECHDL